MKKLMLILWIFLLSFSLASAISVDSVELADLGSSSFVVEVNLDTSGSAQVLYGKTGALGSATSLVSLSSEHLLQVDGLESGTVYFYRVVGKDSSGNSYSSAISLTRTAGTNPSSFGVSGFYLNRDIYVNDQIRELNDGDVIDVSSLPSNTYIAASTTGATESVVFYLNGQFHNTENGAIWTFFNGLNDLQIGTNTITAKSYSVDGVHTSGANTGTAGEEKSIRITITQSQTTTPVPTPSPSPSTNPDIPDVWPSVSVVSVGSKPASSFTLTSASQLSSSANANKVAIVSGNVDLGGATITPVAGLWIQANGGVISNGKLSGSGYTIDPSSKRTLFASSLRFASLYQKPFYSEWYGAKGDDSGNDAIAIKAAIDASTNVHLQNQKYMMSAITLTRPGDVYISGNNAVIEPYGTIYYPYLITIEQSFGNFVFTDLKLDGKNRLCRGYKVRSGFHADNIEIVNIYGDGHSCLAINVEQYDPFDVTIKNSRIHNVKSEPHGISGGTQAGTIGFARAFMWFRNKYVPSSTVVLENNRMGNVYGDDGDVIAIHETIGRYDHESFIYLHNNYLYNGSRRIFKCLATNVNMTNNVFEFIPNGDSNVAAATAGMISFGAHQIDGQAKDLFLTGNVFDNSGEQTGGNIYFGNMKNAQISNNKFLNADIRPMRNIDGVIIEDNEFVNSMIGPYKLSIIPSIKNVQVKNNKIIYTKSRIGADPANSAFIQLWANGKYTNWLIENNVMERESGASDGSAGFTSKPSSSTYSNVVERNNRFATVNID